MVKYEDGTKEQLVAGGQQKQNLEEGETMKDQRKTKKQLINELAEMRQRVTELEASEAERKRAEEELRESREKYREMINGMNDTVWVIGFNGRFIDVNETAVKALGYSREELLPMGPADIDSHLTEEQIRDLIRRIPSDEIQVFETEHTTKKGKTIPVEISSSLVTYQGRRAILSIARDITERKRAEEALHESEERYRSLFDRVPVGLYRTTPAGQILDANPALVQMMGYLDQESLLAVSAADVYVNGRDRAREQALL